LSGESAISTREDSSAVIRAIVAGIAPRWIGNLNLTPGQERTMNVFIERSHLASVVHLEGKANLLLTTGAQHWRRMTPWDGVKLLFIRLRNGQGPGLLSDGRWIYKPTAEIGVEATPEETQDAIDRVLSEAWTLRDAQIDLSSEPLSPDAGLNSAI